MRGTIVFWLELDILANSSVALHSLCNILYDHIVKIVYLISHWT